MRQAPNNNNEEPQSSNNYMSKVKTYIDNSAINIEKEKNNIYDLTLSDITNIEIDNFKGKKITLEKIHQIIFDKTIFSLIKAHKLSMEEYRFLFYCFFNKYFYKNYHERLGHINSEKFFKKFFNACISQKERGIFFNRDITVLINFYIKELFDTITNKKLKINGPKDINDLPLDNINLEQLSKTGIKYIKSLIKYILAFCNILEYSEYNGKYHIAIFETFIKIKDEIFHEYFMKQLYKIFINKGIYKHGKVFAPNIFYPIIYENNKISQHLFTTQTFSLINSILSFVPKYYKTNNNKYSPYYLLNIIVLIKIMDDLKVNEELKQIMLPKFIDVFNSYINLFIDDGSQLKVAEFILTDRANNNIIMNNLDKNELIKPFIKEMDNIYKNQNYWQYFEYLFFDLSYEIFLRHYINDKNSGKNNNLDKSDYFSEKDLNSSEYFADLIITNDKFRKEILENVQKVINKFVKSNDIFISKYFTGNIDLINEEDINIILNKKNLEELFILLDIIYRVSKRSEDQKVIKKSIIDVQNIIQQIIVKSFGEKEKFNCTIFNFLLMIDEQYLPSGKDFNLIDCNNILLGKNYAEFINSYPFYIIFLINYCTKYNYNAETFFVLLNGFMKGSCQNVFNYLDDAGKHYFHTLEFNYLNLIYFIITQILNVHLDKITDNEINNNITLHLPYCIYCKKKLENYLIHSKYLSQCIYCGEKYLYLNTNNLYEYLLKNKKELEKFVADDLYKIITDITCHIIYKYEEKKNNKNDELFLLAFGMFYKIMEEHFKFLNSVQYITGKNIPFVIDPNNRINYKEGVLESIIKNIFEDFKNKRKYPFKIIYECINNDNYDSFNSCRKTIKHEWALAKNIYEKK